MFGPDGLDLGDLLRQSQERMAKLAAVREQMAGLQGRAESQDGRISVTSTAEDPLAEIKIDPRAMRMGSEELAATLQETARRARQDLDAQVQKITADQFGGTENPMDVLKDQDALKKSLTDMQGVFEQAGRQSQQMMDELHRKLGLRDTGK
ncbi:YbaB/EbfC family nucleoid-associated protein [Actinomadura formosensis]|uniref:YbaB/EbfC family nucleoid-associated protein n=1 Tax=Actinomadura formosensis TaxID=60706 RepID=UPI00082C2444|nr:YbaB/EbfC family nucleoid-associated protein [Actinomadura formosensis]